MADNRAYPKKKNTAFIKAMASRYNDLELDFGRENGYSISLDHRKGKRWMMVDMNDSSDQATPHLIIIINVKSGDFTEREIQKNISLPLKEGRSRRKASCFWIKLNQDAIHLQFCNDAFADFNFESDGFLKFIGLARTSFSS